MAKYLLLTFILNILTIMATVIIINVYFRSATTHTMPNCIRHVFLKLLPTLLMMKRPERIPVYNGYFVEEYCVEEIFDASLIMPSITATILPFSQVGRRRNQPQFPERHHRNCSKLKQISKRNCIPTVAKLVEQTEGAKPAAHFSSSISLKSIDQKDTHGSINTTPTTSLQPTPKKSSAEIFSGKYTFGPSLSSCSSTTHLEVAEHSHEQRISEELKSTVESIAYIAEHMKAEMSDKKVRDDWKYISMVIDRLLLIVKSSTRAMTTAESELLGRNASYDVTDMSVGKPGLFERLKHKADDFREYVSTTCCACLASVPSFALVILGVVLVMLLVASIPLAFALTYMKGDPAAAEVPISPIRLFRDHMEWVNDSYSAPEPMIFQSSSVLPPNITACKGFGFACTNEPSHVIATYQRCDGIEQCADGSDEMDCHRCQTTLSCAANDQEKPIKCLRGDMICDGKQDCANGADEKAYCHEICPEDQRKCKNANICLSDNMICDGDAHCPDGEDEKGCSECKNGAKLCKPLSTCIPSGSCVMAIWTVLMPQTSLAVIARHVQETPKPCVMVKSKCVWISRESAMESVTVRTVKCADGIVYDWLYACSGMVEPCDGYCRECNPQTSFDCHLHSSTNASSSLTKCVHRSKVCDGKNDCGNNADEEDCGCNKPGMIKCASQTFAGRDSCYSKDQKCDGYNDCPGGEDELNCAECNRDSFLCSDDKKCILITKRCDGIDDCLDGSDEKGCSCQECMLHPFKTYMCSSGSRCFRLNNVCAPYSQCPNADDRDKLYCAVSQGGGRSYL
uniref:Neurotransmitter-gated ion-channel transmembrane domain-containing protein n=1 Tax=Ditylenchus dipsaci TaxID=166011 RepID=A0A915ES29_9BILA